MRAGYATEPVIQGSAVLPHHATRPGTGRMNRFAVAQRSGRREPPNSVDWHTAPEDHLDWSYGDALIEDEERREAAVRSASERYAALKELVRDNEAFGKERFSETLFLFHLLFGSEVSIR